MKKEIAMLGLCMLMVMLVSGCVQEASILNGKQTIVQTVELPCSNEASCVSYFTEHGVATQQIQEMNIECSGGTCTGKITLVQQ